MDTAILQQGRISGLTCGVVSLELTSLAIGQGYYFTGIIKWILDFET